MNPLEIASAPLDFSGSTITGRLVAEDDERWYEITGLEALPPFFMSLVSDSDHWLFLSSTGALTAGRRDPDQALFPYTTDDRIHDSRDLTGGKTLLRVNREGRAALWEPFSDRYEGLWRIERRLLKGVHGNRVRFEERNLDLGLTLMQEWAPSERFGFARRMRLSSTSDRPVIVELLDGLLNVMPHSLERRFQMEYSTLADGYKRTERLEASNLTLFRLSSIPVDKAEPSEALRVNVAWCTGLEARAHLLCADQVAAFRRGQALTPESDVRGRRGACLVEATFSLDPGTQKDWAFVAEVGLDATAVTHLDRALRETPDRLLELSEDIHRGTENLRRMVAEADGLQVTGDPLSCARHFSNTLFNAMRGGLPAEGYAVDRADFSAFLSQANRDLRARSEAFLAALPEGLDRVGLLDRAEAAGDADLVRLSREYLPFTFSRRHGDPSRPWNIFSIRVKGEQGERLLGYEGNWRDLFQNWEALAHAYPGFLDGMLQKFLDASTTDGHNPYRVTREGFEWEVIDPDDAWSFIGYWGDHQVVYLLKLLEASRRFHPGALEALLDRRLFTFADVPYRLADHAAMLAHPRSTITFDQEAHAAAMARRTRLGSDGLLATGHEGPLRATLAEKLLLVVLSKLSSYVPEGGIWMNTQRPEWNDANNALVGYGVSVVTLAYLRRYVAFLDTLLAECPETSLAIGQELAELLETHHRTLETFTSSLGGSFTPGDRKALLDALGTAGSAYRTKAYAGLSGPLVDVSLGSLRSFCACTLRHLDHSLQANRREDGLWHAYNLMEASENALHLGRLPEMLEGQVAMLSSGILSPDEAADLLDALRASRLFRADLGTYVLYPDTPLPRFLEKNRIPGEDVSASPLLSAMIELGDTRLVNRDAEGQVHFDAAFRNADTLRRTLDALAETRWAEAVAAERETILALYERVFDHRSFTGRSGTFYKYEGLGCVYWHMVSKLLLAVDEVRVPEGDAAPRLAAHYEAIREGLGIHKSPAVHGAIPTDPYSHTPAFAGAQQPGMTGQVKEDLLARLGELGVAVRGGCLTFQPWKLRREDLLAAPARFEMPGMAEGSIALPTDALAFTFCGIPVVLHAWGSPAVLLRARDGAVQVIPKLDLDRDLSHEIFQRTGAITRLDVHLGLD